MKKDVVIYNQKRARKAQNYSSCVISIDLWQAYCCGKNENYSCGDFWIFLQSLPTIHSSHQYLEQMH